MSHSHRVCNIQWHDKIMTMSWCHRMSYYMQGLRLWNVDGGYELISENKINLLFSTSFPVMKWKCELKSNIFQTLFDRIMMRWRLHTDWMMEVSNGKKMKLPERIIHFNIVIGSLEVTSIVVQVQRTYHLQSLLKKKNCTAITNTHC